MKKYSVTINGTTYIAEVEELEAGAVAAAPVAAPKAAPAAPKAVSVPAGATAVKAPMPGTISKINVTAGQAVKKGDVVAILEAMKMENDICAPADGTVSAIAVQKGASVKTDDVILTLK